jgi:hypothetical protein
MSFQINGTTVIDGSRNLTNIANRDTFVADGTANISAGAVGSYAFLGVSSTSYTSLFGETRAGSHLHPAGINGISSWNTNTAYINSSYGGGQNSARAGTWRCMGVTRSAASADDLPNAFGASLWVRIS